MDIGIFSEAMWFPGIKLLGVVSMICSDAKRESQAEVMPPPCVWAFADSGLLHSTTDMDALEVSLIFAIGLPEFVPGRIKR